MTSYHLGWGKGLGPIPSIPTQPKLGLRSEFQILGTHLLSKILEFQAKGSPLSESLASGRAKILSEALQQLNPSDREALRNRWGRSLEELESLSHEQDAQVFYAGLLQVGQRLEDNDQLEQAGLVYSALLAEGPHPDPSPPRGEGHTMVVVNGSLPSVEGREIGMASPSPLGGEGGRRRRTGEGLIPAEIRTRAQIRLNAMTGVGAAGERFAFLAKRLPTEITRPDMLLAMGAAGAAFRLTRLATTARFAKSFESAWALKAAGYGSGFLAETLAFTGVGKLAGQALGYQQDWSSDAIFKEWAGGASMLFGLKVMGGLAGATSRKYAQGSGAFEKFTQAALPQLGMFGGILLGNRLAELGGFHPHREGDAWLIDGISTLIQFNMASRLQSGILGPGFERFERRLDLHTELLSKNNGDFNGGIFSPDFVTPEGLIVPAFGNRKSEIENLHVFSVPLDGETKGNAATTAVPHRLESRFRNGSVIIELETQREFTEAESLRQLKRWEDGFSTILLNYKSATSEKIQGSVAALLRSDKELQTSLLRHLDRAGHRVLVKMDLENEKLQSVVGVDAEGLPTLILTAGEVRDPKKPMFAEDFLLRVEIYSRQSEIPIVKAQRYFYNDLKNVLSELQDLSEALYNGVSRNAAFEEPAHQSITSTPFLSVLFESWGKPEFELEFDRSHPARWKLSRVDGNLLLQMKPEMLDAPINQGRPPISSLPPPLPKPPANKPKRTVEPKPNLTSPIIPKPPPVPKISVKPLEQEAPQTPKVRPPKKSPDSISSDLGSAMIPLAAEAAAPKDAAAPGDAPRARNLSTEGGPIQALALWGKLLGNIEKGRRLGEKDFAGLESSVRRIPDSQILRFACDVFENVGPVLRNREFEADMFIQILKRIPEGNRPWALTQVGAYLGETGPAAAHAFEILREVIPKLNGFELTELKKFLEQRFSSGGHQKNLTSMVFQTLLVIKEQYRSAGF